MSVPGIKCHLTNDQPLDAETRSCIHTHITVSPAQKRPETSSSRESADLQQSHPASGETTLYTDQIRYHLVCMIRYHLSVSHGPLPILLLNVADADRATSDLLSENLES